MTQVRFTLAGLLVAVSAMVVTLSWSGGTPQSVAPGLPDAGPFVGWSVVFLTLWTQITAVGTIGMLLVPVFLLPGRGDVVEGLAVDAVIWARRIAWGWALGMAVLFFFRTAELFARPLNGLTWEAVSAFAGDGTGRGVWLQALAAAVVAVCLYWTISVRMLSLLLGLALAGLAPVALTGHAASSGSHSMATITMLLHLIGVTLWVGGLAGLAWVASRGSKRTEPAIKRFSTIAGWAFVIVAASGVLNASTRFISLEQLFSTPYGRVVVLKILLLLALGGLGWWQRRRLVSQGAGFIRVAVVEVFLMAVTMGVAVALSRTPPPVEEVLLTPAENLLGGLMPPPPTVGRLLFSLNPSGFGVAVVGLGAALYLAGVMTLRRRGDAWPVGRTIAWMVGLVMVAWATLGGLGTYSHVLFSAHMVSHMVISMVAPIFLVLGAPFTLALRALPGPRQPGEVSPRALLMSFLHSRYSRFITHPIVAPVIFVASLYGLYFTPLFEVLMTNHLGHVLMEFHFLAAGFLLYYVLIGIDPAPRQLPPLARFALLLIVLPFHAFFSIALMSATTVIAEPYWSGIERPFLTDLLHDQYLGGSISWALGEVPLLIVMLALLAQWFRSDQREAKRFDRVADRDGDAELRAYNERLRQLAERDRS